MTPADSDETSTAKKTAIETVHLALRHRIVEGEMQPGEKLHIDRLRQEFDVSTSTMREAVSRLLVDNLVTSASQRGFAVAPMSLKDFSDITETRIVLESTALRGSLAARDDGWEANLVAAFHRLSRLEGRMFAAEHPHDLADDWDALNTRFHDALAANCDNAWLIKLRRLMHRQSYRYQRIVLANTSIRRDVSAEHKAIFDAAMDGRIEDCVALVTAHIRETYVDIKTRPAFFADWETRPAG